MDDSGSIESTDTPGHAGADAADDDTTVLELFGFKLHVSNPRLAEVLAMDAREAMLADVRELADPTAIRQARETLAEAAPEVMVAPATAYTEDESRQRVEIRQQ
ncbi:MAG: hypothetical protein Q8K99_08850, partial [Actinomycetota bacterium]|nr:hypothetical protein [Actinomycetota bacterium]